MTLRQLVSLPDCKTVHRFLTVGQYYVVVGSMGNGLIVQTSDPYVRLLMLDTRFA